MIGVGFLVILLVVVGGILALAAGKPSTFRVSRSLSVDAPAESIFPLIEDFHRWTAWSPWEEMDPGMKRTHEGAARGKGAVYSWEGNSKVGAGRMEIVSATSAQALTIKLDFLRPFEGHNTADFTLEPAGKSTLVTWAVHGPMAFMAKVMSVFVTMDQLMGKDLERGLTRLKRAAEGGPPTA